MKQNFESIKSAVELIYKTLEEQIEEKGCLSGNTYFDETKLDKLNNSKPMRNEIWDRIENEFEDDAFKIACAIQAGFLYLADTEVIREAAKQFWKIRGKIEKYIEKQNQWLANKAPYFKNYPIHIQIHHHHLDNSNPPEKYRPKEGKSELINYLSTLMKKNLPEEAERSTYISAILENFFAVPSDPGNVSKHQ